MDAELTNRSRDAINAASNRAVTEGHADLTPAHLLLALLQGQDNENITDLLAAVVLDGHGDALDRGLRGLPAVADAAEDGDGVVIGGLWERALGGGGAAGEHGAG